MLSGYRIIPFIPAGRQRVMSILLDNLRRFPEIDEVQVWRNTHNQPEDDAWLAELPAQWSKIRLLDLPHQYERKVPKQLNTGKFYEYTQDEDALYFRFDDDIVWIDDNYFTNMVKFRLENPNNPIIYGHIWNNAICSYIDQQRGLIDNDHGVVASRFCMDPVGWQSGKFAEHIHRILLDRIAKGTVSDLYFDREDLVNTRFSISNFCFFGREMKYRDLFPQIDDEEIWLAERYPKSHNTFNVICGSAIVSHYSFFDQRPHLDQTDILQQYRELGQSLLSRDYYKLLGEQNSL